MSDKILHDGCVDCQSVESTLKIRNRRLCSDCFIRYINSKVLKRMESYRFKHDKDTQSHRLLLPVSGGISSLVLLQILESQMQRQILQRKRTAYELHILTVDETLSSGDLKCTSRGTWYQTVQTQFPSLCFIPIKSLSDVFSTDCEIEEDLKNFGFRRKEAESDAEYALRILASASSLTAGADLHQILLSRLILSSAKERDCEAILWGHSDSRLAAKALAGVAKGRGGSLPFEICDEPSRSGIHFNYPLRDLFKPELTLYASLLPDAFARLVEGDEPAPPEKASIRNTSIDELLTNYINSQGEKYSSITANVVRTASKLQASPLHENTASCRICLVPYQRDSEQVAQAQNLCYACSRTLQDIRNEGT